MHPNVYWFFHSSYLGKPNIYSSHLTRTKWKGKSFYGKGPQIRRSMRFGGRWKHENGKGQSQGEGIQGPSHKEQRGLELASSLSKDSWEVGTWASVLSLGDLAFWGLPFPAEGKAWWWVRWRSKDAPSHGKALRHAQTPWPLSAHAAENMQSPQTNTLRWICFGPEAWVLDSLESPWISSLPRRNE